MTGTNSETKTIKGIKITLATRGKGWIIYHRFTDEYNNLLKPRSKTFGSKSGATNIEIAFNQAHKWITDTQNKINEGYLTNSNNLTLGEYIENEWNPNRPRTATYDRYHLQLQAKAFNKIKRMKISAINLRVIKDLFKVISTTKSKRTGRAPSIGSLENYKKALSNVFKSAIANNIIESNPTLNLEIRRFVSNEQLIEESSRRLQNRNAFSKHDMKLILKEIKKEDFQMYVLVKIMVLTGLRTQEVVALDIKHSINLEKNYLLIDQSATYVKGKGTILKPTKTSASRKVYFNEDVKKVIKQQIVRKMTELNHKMSSSEFKAQKQLFLFSSHRKHPNRLYQVQWIGKRFTKYTKDLDVEHYQLYSCRHTYATWQLSSGSKAEVIAQSMGHSVETFYRYYLHDLDDDKKLIGQKDLLN